ncbi:hypothetical protein F5Y01DRAFT_239267 [Xylaria sp. FL0043]|nr:hypothetical protein F5Y01DRAFT_239267 [Xylaria sp. FL0043]
MKCRKKEPWRSPIVFSPATWLWIRTGLIASEVWRGGNENQQVCGQRHDNRRAVHLACYILHVAISQALNWGTYGNATKKGYLNRKTPGFVIRSSFSVSASYPLSNMPCSPIAVSLLSVTPCHNLVVVCRVSYIYDRESFMCGVLSYV